ncbi:tetraacyldisaccharide 4'-kinase [Tuwongella immobilis]|uniref:Tetraacyldisaccharide 4'-kinase n=1 Tax=Tuwongella immobilis TaxID=692036 RepID=A0A6C2YL19_9BACT|nr:tetraacyldisaccharide 4'-kinase [Tuwongella immobilis]VIP02126.1 tetraacyldisaccharide 4 -kinase : Tetraacyldisaccharide 4'-kinase OS=Singulisphaera acidiphila (strain ATCC BAA-1392 / DSM 18658 / VKM B-2454 / MOB10) GN=lpxK PE=3 SV=1: LpxK [Tuwongella immobilis]VTS00464.1 tetraacyldisaccharide 4 -kinase : Tetraacyldisaccharide 4'-kinase OS=Singulisphaera acidiphila (strain ATCC BAA-1392 / DSM 18658 / VKM B-2454 / MOB10) GN=lpxK PE=3 SV=1: LpxK [Tuwongella immobilis]
MGSRLRDWVLSVIRGRRGVLASMTRAGLWTLQWPYRLAVAWRNRQFDRGVGVVGVGVPVISVGNLTVGGTGKTPFVEYLAQFLRDSGLQVCILSRGYGSDGGRNDEAMVLEENLPDVPHLQAADRVTLALTAREELAAEVLILDDGFQHRRLARTCDLVLLDATDPFGQEHCLPRGLLREPIRNLRRAHMAIISRADQVSPDELQAIRTQIQRIAPDLPIATAVHQPLELLGVAGQQQACELLAGRSVVAFCGIGNPEAFRHSLEQLGATIRAFRSFPDHHAYSRDDVADLERWVESQADADAWVLTTQKDFVKLQIESLADRPVWALRIGMGLREGEERLQALLEQVAASPSVPLPDELDEE